MTIQLVHLNPGPDDLYFQFRDIINLQAVYVPPVLFASVVVCVQQPPEWSAVH